MKTKKQVSGISAVLCLMGYTLFWLAVGLLANGCTVESRSTEPVCATGATQGCLCPTGESGAQICVNGETEWNECTCAPPPKAPEYPSELRVKRLVLVDDEGRERAILAMSEGKRPQQD